MNEQEISNSSNKAGHKRRGPFLPRDDLANNNDDDSDELSNNSNQSNELLKNNNTTNNNSKPPQPPTNKRKKMKHIPVKSSGYGQYLMNVRIMYWIMLLFGMRLCQLLIIECCWCHCYCCCL